MLAVLGLVAILLGVSVGTVQSLSTSSRQQAAQLVLAGLEQARSAAVKHGTPQWLAVRNEPNTGEYRQIGVPVRIDGTDRIEWRTLPGAAVLRSVLPPNYSTGTNVLATQPPARSFIDPSLFAQPLANQTELAGVAFGRLGAVVFPDPTTTPGPLYFVIGRNGSPFQSAPDDLIVELRPATGRSQLMP